MKPTQALSIQESDSDMVRRAKLLAVASIWLVRELPATERRLKAAMKGVVQRGDGRGGGEGIVAHIDQPDRAAEDLERLRTFVKAADQAADSAMRLAQRQSPTRQMKKPLLKCEVPGCKENEDGFTDCGGLLPSRMHLSRWCKDFILDNERMPTREELRQHDERGYVRRAS